MFKKKRAVLIGAGHAHLHLVHHSQVFHDAGVQLTLVDPGNFWYSGMATGMLSGFYAPEEDQISVPRLTEKYNITYIQGRLKGLSVSPRFITTSSGDEIPYDVLSFNIGSQVNSRTIPGADKWPRPVKPIPRLWELRQDLEKRFRSGKTTSILVAGGGAAGCEIAACLRELADKNPSHKTSIAVLSAQPRLLSEQTRSASRTIAKAMAERDIKITYNTRLIRVEESKAFLSSGLEMSFDFLILATGLEPPALLKELGLLVDQHGGLRVNSTLQSLNNRRVFGAGDCVSIDGYSLPKLGVYGVREAPFLLDNILAFIHNRPLKRYKPQRNCLSILNLGRGEGLACWGPFHMRGRFALGWKDRIDRRFMKRYSPKST